MEYLFDLLAVTVFCSMPPRFPVEVNVGAVSSRGDHGGGLQSNDDRQVV